MRGALPDADGEHHRTMIARDVLWLSGGLLTAHTAECDGRTGEKCLMHTHTQRRPDFDGTSAFTSYQGRRSHVLARRVLQGQAVACSGVIYSRGDEDPEGGKTRFRLGCQPAMRVLLDGVALDLDDQ